MRAAFQQGYQRLIPWPERYPGEIDAFIAARGLDMFNFVLNNQIELDVSLEDFADRIERRMRKLVS